jgi:2'-5' RNA ligase
MRLFFAIWPDAEAARALAEVAQSLADLAGGKPVPPAKIHLTLAFLGEVDESAAKRAVEAAESVRAKPFPMTLDEVGSFRGARVAWAGSSRVPAELTSLQSSLETGLRSRGFELEARPYVPHATLARRIARPVPRVAIAPIAWQAREFTLVQTLGGRYPILESWILG